MNTTQLKEFAELASVGRTEPVKVVRRIEIKHSAYRKLVRPTTAL